MTFIQVSGAV